MNSYFYYSAYMFRLVHKNPVRFLIKYITYKKYVCFPVWNLHMHWCVICLKKRYAGKSFFLRRFFLSRQREHECLLSNDIQNMSQKFWLDDFFYTKTRLPPLGCQTFPSQRVATGQKTWKPQKIRKIFNYSYSHSNIRSYTP